MLKNISIKNYSYLLEKENETLKRKISRLENERDRAVAEKDNAIGMLNKYMAEYEALLADARELSEKQMESEKVADGIVEGMRREFGRIINKEF